MADRIEKAGGLSFQQFGPSQRDPYMFMVLGQKKFKFVAYNMCFNEPLGRRFSLKI